MISSSMMSHSINCFYSSNHWNCSGGAAGYIDRMVFGPNHIKDVLNF